MSSAELIEAEVLLCQTANPLWKNSSESIRTQKVTKLTQSESLFPIPSKFDSDVTVSELELQEINADEFKSKRAWELVQSKSRFPRLTQTKSLLRNELEILKINMSLDDRVNARRETEVMENVKMDSKRKGRQKYRKILRKSGVCCQGIVEYPKHGLQQQRHSQRDLLTEIKESESAKRDKKIWKFLKRGPDLKKDLLNARKLLLEIQTLGLTDSYIQCSQPTRITCPNCRFFITTTIKRVSTVRTKIASFIFAIIGLCIIPHIFYVFKDTVHTCPLCKIYLGFCPAFGIRNTRRELRLAKFNSPELIFSPPELITEAVENKNMVSASSTSAKNLFVESKLRLSDRVQVNVNNIAAIARQIQRGSKASESLMTAAKNFALQEAAIENSETNLKKLKLLTTHLNNQIDYLHNTTAKMDVVLEQVCSMQR